MTQADSTRNMDTLRNLLSNGDARALRAVSVLLDMPVADPLNAIRTKYIHTQIIAALALRSLVRDMGFELDNRIDLSQLIRLCRSSGIIGAREERVLWGINQRGNRAKHELLFRPRLLCFIITRR